MAKPRAVQLPAPTRVTRGSVSKPSDPSKNAGWGNLRPVLPPTHRKSRGTVSNPSN